MYQLHKSTFLVCPHEVTLMEQDRGYLRGGILVYACRLALCGLCGFQDEIQSTSQLRVEHPKPLLGGCKDGHKDIAVEGRAHRCK